MDPLIIEIGQKARDFNPAFENVITEINKVIVGQDRLIRRLIISLLCEGHILLEGVPGLAKTLSVKSLAGSLKLDFKRIQFTPDLMPADLIGTRIYNQHTAEFTVRKGPIFANIILADEINRAPAKVQSALLEAMQEHQVTIGQESFPLAPPFMVLATQNPIEQEGTYPLPEAQIDRFMLKTLVSYPTVEEELLIVERMTGASIPTVSPVMDYQTLNQAKELLPQIYVDDKIKKYIINLVNATRYPDKYKLDAKQLIEFGASPRASIFLLVCARANAFINGRGYVIPEDIKEIAPDILRHRVILSYEAEAEEITTDILVERLLETIEVP